jgi:hypothetical protein
LKSEVEEGEEWQLAMGELPLQPNHGAATTTVRVGLRLKKGRGFPLFTGSHEM